MMDVRRSFVWAWMPLAVLAGCASVGAPRGGVGPASGPDGEAVALAVARAETCEHLFDPAREDSLLAREQSRPTAERVGLWARRFAAATDVRYVFGLAEGGYAVEGDLVSDRHQDCVSLMYRCSELARARDHRDAVTWALRTRFAGAPPESLVTPDGRVDYEHARHLDFSLDMVRSGHWGNDVTARLSGATPDTCGSARYRAGSFVFVPKTALRPGDLREGDVVWFVLNPAHASGARLRDEYGLVIGHIGLVAVEAGVPWLVHAASSGLEGWYEGGTVVQVPLREYLARLDRFSGVMVTRFD